MKLVAAFYFFFFFLISTCAVAQTHTPRLTSMAPGTLAYYEYLPEGYDGAKADTYPLILFMPGIGQMSTGFTSQIDRVLEIGLPKVINDGLFPKSFVVNGETFKFIVITPQFDKRTDASLPQAADMDLVLNYIIQHYKVDLNRIYITGLSYGGGLSFAYPGSSAAYAQRVAAIAPVASPIPTGGDPTIIARSRVIAQGNVAVWATHNERDNDDPVATTRTYIANINSPVPPDPAARMTIFPVSGHDAWTRTYDPTRKEFDGKSVYEWLLQWTRARFTVPNVSPTANAGTDQTIALPTTTVSLSGSGQDSDGSIASYAWSKVSGPSGTITSPNNASTSITGLSQGSYVFRLTVTDNKGATASDDVTVIVNAAPNVAPVVKAGPDQTITLPTNSVTLNGTATDADGNLATLSWTKVSGGAATIGAPAAAVTTISGLVAGVYTFRLTATDAANASTADEVTVTVNEAPNQAPSANAGADQTITLPTNTVTLSGTGTDADGTIAQFNWTKTAGPEQGTITNPTAQSTTVTGLTQGVYTFQLKVTDAKGATDTDDVTITVNAAPNKAPQASAGPDQTITLPLNKVTVNGSVSDADGTIVEIVWAKISGPAGNSIASPNAAVTEISQLQEGVYVFRISVKDNNNATASDDVTITVNAAPNVAPSASAGADVSLVLPQNSTTLSGTAADTDGTIGQISWTKLSGPASGTITSPNTLVTTVTGLGEGSYIFKLSVTDNDGAVVTDEVTITVSAAPNVAPTANAGTDQTISLPTTTVSLSGSGQDSDGSIASFAWSKVSGPSGTITSPNNASTSITGLSQGSYVFRLTVTDNKGATASDDVTVIVNAAPNVAPVVKAGPDQTITLPTNSVTLNGTATDADGNLATLSWTKVSGGAATIGAPAAAVTTISGLVAGVYTFRLTATDAANTSTADEVTVTVNEAPNQAPSANAGADQTITLPTNTVTLSGEAVDEDGSILSTTWTKLSGPAGDVLANANGLKTSVSGLIAGNYVYRLTVVDNKNASATDDITITVNEANNQTPTANAGKDQTITLPQNSVSLTGSGTDADGTITSYLWTKISGPQKGTITNKDLAITSATGLAEGIYTFRVTVTDNKGAAAADDVVITVVAEPVANKLPVVNAGVDQTITLPLNSTTFQGNATDEDGTIASYAWSLVSGPAGASIASPAAPTTLISNLKEGQYIFRFEATDNTGATATDDISLTVNAAPVNKAPVAVAGADRTITLPRDSINLFGAGSDADGTVAAYKWTQVSGPATAVILNADSATAAATNLTQGVYLFRLTVRDSDSATASDDVLVTVLAAAVNIPPSVDAGSSQAIVLPLDSVVLKGAVSDSDGTIATYVWTQVSGPEGAKIVSPNSVETIVTSLQQGSYVFLLSVMDNSGAIASDSVRVDVTIVLAVDDPVADNFKLLVAPNPSTTSFALKLTSPSAKPVYLRISDVLGRVVEERRNLQRNSVITIGATYRPGVYFAEVVQDGRRRVVKLLK